MTLLPSSPKTQSVIAACFRERPSLLPTSIERELRAAFGISLDHVSVRVGPRCQLAAKKIGARAFAFGSSIVLGEEHDLYNLRLLAHELAHVIQSQGQVLRYTLEPPDSATEAEADHVAERVMRGNRAGAIRTRLSAIARTPNSEAIRRLTSYSWDDWAVTTSEQKQVLLLLEGDPNPLATIQDLNSSNRIGDVFHRMEHDQRLELAQVIGGRIDEVTGAAIRSHIVFYPRGKGDVPDNAHLFLFDVSCNLQNRLRALGLVKSAPAFNTASIAGLIGRSPTAPFGGVGATGVSPRDKPAIPLKDQYYMWKGVDAYRQLYDNPLGDLDAYLASLTPLERKQQAQLLLKQPISSLVPFSYGGKIPSRAQAMETAASVYNLHGPVIAAFVLAEQRDQTGNEDAKDYQAAISILQMNTSIGLGQVVISTAQKNDLFADLLSKPYRSSLTHDQIAMLLTSDEFNIFAAARYIRLTASAGALIGPAALPKTHAAYPGLDMAAYARNSRLWPEANIAALGSEYTSKPWDDVVTGWGSFVLECYRDVIASGVF